jgi:hypothetical protein
MIRYLNSNRPLFGVVLLILSAIFGAASIYIFEPIVLANPLIAAADYAQIDFRLLALISMIAIFMGGQQINKLFAKHELHNKNTVIPGLIFVMWGGALSCFYSQPHCYLAYLPLIYALSRMLEIFRQNRVLAECFESGLGLGLAIVLHPPLIVLILFAHIAIMFARTFNWREHFNLFLGYLLPLAWLFSIYFLADIQPQFFWSNLGSGLSPGLLTALALPLSALIGLNYFTKSYGKSTNKSRNTKNTAAIISLGLMVVVVLSYFKGLFVDMSLLLFPCILFSSFAFLELKKTWFANFLLFLVLISPLFQLFL